METATAPCPHCKIQSAQLGAAKDRIAALEKLIASLQARLTRTPKIAPSLPQQLADPIIKQVQMGRRKRYRFDQPL